MFTGIVERIGVVIARNGDQAGSRLTVDIGPLAAGLTIGDSIAVNGVCLTAVEVRAETATVDVVSETLRRSNLGSLAVGDRVNLERPLAAGGRFDGHIVQGHVDGSARVTALRPDGESQRMSLGLVHELGRYVVEKGSIAIDGVSLTVAALTDEGFDIALIPHTLQVTTLGLRRVGDLVNLEFDVVAKYVERMLELRS